MHTNEIKWKYWKYIKLKKNNKLFSDIFYMLLFVVKYNWVSSLKCDFNNNYNNNKKNDNESKLNINDFYFHDII